MTLLCVAQGVSACSLAPMELREVSPDLMVVVTHRGKPVAGIEVRVVPEKAAGPAFSGVTDVDGRVLIKGLMAGRYHLTASHEDFDAGREWIEVVAVPGAKTKTRFDFEWVDSSYETRKIAGTLTGLVPGDTGKPLVDISHPRETVFSGVEVTLKNAFSTDEYRTVSDSTGAFVFSGVPDGIYVLTVAGGMKSVTGTADVTRQIVDLTHNAAAASLPLKLKDAGCYRTEFQLGD